MCLFSSLVFMCLCIQITSTFYRGMTKSLWIMWCIIDLDKISCFIDVLCVGNIVSWSKLMWFMVVINGNIFYFPNILQVICEGKLSKYWTVLQHAKFLLDLNIAVKYSNAQLTRGRWHHVYHVPKCASTNSLYISRYKVNNVEATQNR